MKTRGISCLAAIAILLTLTACAGPPLTDKDQALETKRHEKEFKIAEKKAEVDKAELTAISTMSQEQKGMAYMGKQMKEMFAMVVDKDAKKEKGFYEMKEGIARQQNDITKYSIKTGAGLLKNVGLGWLIADIIKNGQDKAGDRITTGDDATIEHNRISSKSKTDTNQVGDNNATGAVDASTVGPDKSSTVTEVVAPEESVVEEPEIEEPEGEEGEFVPAEPPDFDDLPIDIPEVPEEAK